MFFKSPFNEADKSIAQGNERGRRPLLHLTSPTANVAAGGMCVIEWRLYEHVRRTHVGSGVRAGLAGARGVP